MEDLRTNNRTILNLLLRNLNGNLETGFIWSEINTFFRLFWKRKQHMGSSLKCRELFSSLATNYSNDQIRRRWAGHKARMGACRVLVGKPERKRPLGRPRRRWDDNIKMNFQEVGWGH
jgi:hypothetical protein